MCGAEMPARMTAASLDKIATDSTDPRTAGAGPNCSASSVWSVAPMVSVCCGRERIVSCGAPRDASQHDRSIHRQHSHRQHRPHRRLAQARIVQRRLRGLWLRWSVSAVAVSESCRVGRRDASQHDRGVVRQNSHRRHDPTDGWHRPELFSVVCVVCGSNGQCLLWP